MVVNSCGSQSFMMTNEVNSDWHHTVNTAWLLIRSEVNADGHKYLFTPKQRKHGMASIADLFFDSLLFAIILLPDQNGTTRSNRPAPNNHCWLNTMRVHKEGHHPNHLWTFPWEACKTNLAVMRITANENPFEPATRHLFPVE